MFVSKEVTVDWLATPLTPVDDKEVSVLCWFVCLRIVGVDLINSKHPVH